MDFRALSSSTAFRALLYPREGRERIGKSVLYPRDGSDSGRYEYLLRMSGITNGITGVPRSYGVLHGGISAFIAESLGSLGAYMASGFQPIAGVEISTSHLRPAPVGTEIEAKAVPVHVGRRLHVWEVKLISAKRSHNDLPKQDSSKTSEPGLISVSKFTVTVLPSSPTAKNQDAEMIPSKL